MSFQTPDLHLAEVKEEFSLLDSWSLKYELLIEGGRDLPPLATEKKTEENFVSGCVSSVWVTGSLTAEGLSYEGDSDGILPKGLVALLIRLYNHCRPQDVAAWKGDVVKELGLERNLTPTRISAFRAMDQRFKKIAAESAGGQ